MGNRAKNSDIISEYLDTLTTVKSYLEEQIYLGFSETQINRSSQDDSKEQSESSIVVYNNMDEIRSAVESCQLCPLHKTRTNVVFGDGSEEAKLVFVGEAPGTDEDKQGKPFVGKAGQKLTQIIEAMGLSRPEVYIANVLKCRPPRNRNPKPEEIETCEPYLIAQLRLIKPRIICALGTFAAQTLLRSDKRISTLRGRFHTYQGIRLMPTYHPAYLLRNPKFKRDVWEDVQKIMAEYS
ncbi:uracil-DNA glycosylase [Candidatus Poribacteria bacterium]|nr:uracil-DNA glycosylase [Candidatus Poribacteria bacterium]